MEDRYCLKCNKKLSVYNRQNICFCHQDNDEIFAPTEKKFFTSYDNGNLKIEEEPEPLIGDGYHRNYRALMFD